MFHLQAWYPEYRGQKQKGSASAEPFLLVRAPVFGHPVLSISTFLLSGGTPMVQECAHLYENGRKCRRIPRRGDPLCPAHRSPRRRRSPLEENEAFMDEIFDFASRLKAMPLDDLFYATGQMLANIQVLIDRRSSRRNRMDFCRATAAISVTVDRLADIAIASRAQFAETQAIGGQLPPAAATSQPAHATHAQARSSSTAWPDPFTRKRIEQQLHEFEMNPQLSPEQLQAAVDNVISILDSYEKTTSTLESNA
jgi:hypothetical protein